MGTALPYVQKITQFKGTLSRDGLGFWWHVWLVLGQNRGRAINREKYTFCNIKSLEHLQNLKKMVPSSVLGLKLTTHVIKGQIHLARQSLKWDGCISRFTHTQKDVFPTKKKNFPEKYMWELLLQNIFDIIRNQIRIIIAKTDHFSGCIPSCTQPLPCHEGENQTAGSCVQ